MAILLLFSLLEPETLNLSTYSYGINRRNGCQRRRTGKEHIEMETS
jgi:hypothetical protein